MSVKKKIGLHDFRQHSRQASHVRCVSLSESSEFPIYWLVCSDVFFLKKLDISSCLVLLLNVLLMTSCADSLQCAGRAGPLSVLVDTAQLFRFAVSPVAALNAPGETLEDIPVSIDDCFTSITYCSGACLHLGDLPTGVAGNLW